MRLCGDSKRLSRPRVGSPHPDRIWKSQGCGLRFTVREQTGKAAALASPSLAPPPPRRPGSGSDGHGSALLLPRGRTRQMPTWQRLGLVVPPRRLGQGRSPRGRWSLEPRMRVRQAVAEQTAAGRGSGSLGGVRKVPPLSEREHPVWTNLCVCGGGWGREDGMAHCECVGRRGRDHSEGDGGPLPHMESGDHSESGGLLPLGEAKTILSVWGVRP